MPDLSPTDLGAVAAVDAIARGVLTAIALTEACLARIETTDHDLEAWATVDADGARRAADDRDADRAAGRPLGALHGVPIGIKDIVDVAGMPTTAGAPAFAHTHPTRDATLVARLRAAGAVIVGKTVATPFAFKDPAATRNPWSAERTPGGSSSGSAAAVAARHVPATIGTQTVGSILRPAAYCGVVGLKGAHGRVPLDGVLPLAPSLDHAGPIARSVADVAIIQGVIAGAPFDPTDATRPRLGVAGELFDRAEPDLRAQLVEVVERWVDAGATLVEIELPPSFQDIVEAGLRILEGEAAVVHASRFADHGAEYPPGIAALIRAGQALDGAAVERAERTLATFRAEMTPILDSVDALVSPVAPGPAPLRAAGTGDFALCAPWSDIGVPSIAIPSGNDTDGLPLAVQLVAGPDGLAGLLGVAAWGERILAFEARPPA